MSQSVIFTRCIDESRYLGGALYSAAIPATDLQTPSLDEAMKPKLHENLVAGQFPAFKV